ncbi:hypothetical protein [Anaerobium acetethylicum]|uniref:Iron-only hydrogenase system regulator n=1 Tax=Anaerobium acetethylicum TaxID=1619234 RepID=A0A1D3TVF2_9FIRM|nr:hypothetical protein [Anaerobium acetethylicum]SCP98095.1 hypothetical protein SAMN05421730_101666 [Anaerobium acetethylicum]
MSKVILGIKVQERVNTVSEVQKLISKHACEITTRLGLHEATPDTCSTEGIIVLEFREGAEESAYELEKELTGYGHVNVQKMVF